MIRTNIWVFFIFYVIYALFSVRLFLSTSGGWLAVFFYLTIGSLYYIASAILLFLTATFRTRRKQTKVSLNVFVFLRIIAFQAFVVLFNYNTCGDSVCPEGFLATFLEETSFPILFTPPFALVVFALLLYFILLALFLLDLT